MIPDFTRDMPQQAIDGVSNVAGQVQPQQMYIPPTLVQERLYIEAERTRMHMAAQIAIQNNDRAWQEFFLRLQEEMREKRMRTIEENRLKRAFANFGVFADSGGQICYEIRDADGKRIGAKPLLKCTGLTMKNFWSACWGRRVDVHVVTWPNHFVTLNGSSPKELEKQLGKAGLAIRCGRDRREMLVELLFEYLLAHEEVVELPYAVGWNRMASGKWHFAKDEEQTLRGCLNA